MSKSCSLVALRMKYDTLIFVGIIILSYEILITTNNKIYYFGFNFKWKSTYSILESLNKIDFSSVLLVC